MKTLFRQLIRLSLTLVRNFCLLCQLIRSKDFVRDKEENTPAAAKELCNWVRALHAYQIVALEIEPKKVTIDFRVNYN